MNVEEREREIKYNTDKSDLLLREDQLGCLSLIQFTTSLKIEPKDKNIFSLFF